MQTFQSRFKLQNGQWSEWIISVQEPGETIGELRDRHRAAEEAAYEAEWGS